MLREQLIFCRNLRYRRARARQGFPASELTARVNTGIGWTHSNLMQVCFGPIFDTPFGAVATS